MLPDLLLSNLYFRNKVKNFCTIISESAIFL